MSTFFSGTDTATLQSEGYDTNCFVSLIVNNEGTYCAAITRKMQLTTEVVTKSLGTSYEFFGEGKIKTDEDPMSEATRVLSKEIIEYFMLDVEREVVDNPFEFLDKRFEEIEAQKKSATTQASSWLLRPETLEEEDNDYSFYDWQKKHSKVTQPLLFSKEEMGIPEPQDWEPDPDTIHYMVCQMVTCSLIVNASIDLEQWISKHMEEKYCEIFENSNITQFDDWKEFIIEFLINGYCDATTPEELLEDYDMYQSKLASALYTELSKYEDNSYLTEYKETLKRFIYD